MQQTQILLHIRAIFYFLSETLIIWKNKFYYILNLLETEILLHFTTAFW